MTPDQSAIVKQPFFYLFLVSIVVGAIEKSLHEYGITVAPLYLAILSTVSLTVNGLAFGMAALWSPSRQAWTPEMRQAMGLPPMPPLALASSPFAPPLTNDEPTKPGGSSP